MKIEDKVKFTGTREQDNFHGELVGKTGTVRQLFPWTGVDFDGDGSIYSCPPSSLTEQNPS